MSTTFRWTPEGQSYPLLTAIHNEDGTSTASLYFENGRTAQEIHYIPVEALRAFVGTLPELPAKGE